VALRRRSDGMSRLGLGRVKTFHPSLLHAVSIVSALQVFISSIVLVGSDLRPVSGVLVPVCSRRSHLGFAYALIAATSGLVPTMFMTRVRL